MWVTNFVTEKTKTVFSLFIVASIHSQLQFGFLTLSKQKNAVHVNFYYHHFTNQVYENKQRKDLGVDCLRKKQNYKSIEIGISQAKFGLATVREEIWVVLKLCSFLSVYNKNLGYRVCQK